MFSPGTLNGLLAQRLQRGAESPACSASGGRRDDPQSVTWQQLSERAFSFAAGLLALGLRHGARVGVVGPLGLQAFIAELGTLFAGGVHVGLHEQWTQEELLAALRVSGCSFVMTGSRELALRLVALREQLPELERVVSWGRAASLPGVLPFGQICLRGEEVEPRSSHAGPRSLRAAKTDELAIVTFEEGEPTRGHALTHGAAHHQAKLMAEVTGIEASDVVLSLVPAGRFGSYHHSYHLALATGAHLVLPNSPRGWLEAAEALRPTVIAIEQQDVPRLFTLAMDRAASASVAVRTSGEWALRVGSDATQRREDQGSAGPWLGLGAKIADRLVFSNVRAAFGGRLRCLVVDGCAEGEAALIPSLLGVRSVVTWVPPGAAGPCAVQISPELRRGSIGKPPPGTVVEVGEGGLLARGPHVRPSLFPPSEESGSMTAAPVDCLRVPGRFSVDDEGFLWSSEDSGRESA